MAAQTLIDHSGGFASNGDLTATGITTFNGSAADLTTGDGGEQSGNLFADSRVNIQDFTTTFDFQMQPQSTSPLGDGLTFIIQNDTGHPSGPDYGESTIRLSPTPGRMTVVDSFTPFDFKARDNIDADTGSGSVTLLPDFPGTAHPHEAVEVDKAGRLYLVDQDNLGGFNPGGPDRVLQEFMANPNGLIYSSPVYFDGKIYIQGVGDVIKAFALQLDPSTNTMMLNETPVSEGTTVSGFPGTVQSVSANGTSNGIVWAPQVDGFASGGPAILRAYDANNLSTPLYSSNQAGPRDTAGGGVKFTTPTIANGHVYLGTQFEVDVYGLLPRPGSVSHSVRTAARTLRNPKQCAVAGRVRIENLLRFSAAGPSPRSVRWWSASPPPHPPPIGRNTASNSHGLQEFVRELDGHRPLADSRCNPFDRTGAARLLRRKRRAGWFPAGTAASVGSSEGTAPVRSLSGRNPWRLSRFHRGANRSAGPRR